jgi:predicted KAP-like P-loop ATPase
MCKNCKNEFHNKGISECKCVNEMTIEEYDMYFAGEKSGCPYFMPIKTKKKMQKSALERIIEKYAFVLFTVDGKETDLMKDIRALARGAK